MEDKKKFSITNFQFALKKLFYYLRIWVLMSKNSFLVYFNQRLILTTFLLGKIFRFSFFLIFIFFLVKGAEKLAGYSVNQTVFFFLTFNLVDILAQFLFREVYRFRHLLISGDFDLVLVKPINTLFRVLMGGADVIDLITIPPLLLAVVYIGRSLNPTTAQIFLYSLLIINSLFIASAFHIAVVSLGILTLEIDHTILIYRDLVNLGKFPVDIYKEPLRGILTYFIPVGVMITFPAKALIGMVSPTGVLISFVLGAVLLFASIKFWHWALKFYTSAST